MPYTRRQFTHLALAALPACGLAPALGSLAAAAEKGGSTRPNSKVNGVQIGLNVPYSFSNPTMSGAEILSRCQQLNLSAVELRAQPVEAFLGLPAILVATKGADAANAERLRQWRKSAPVGKIAEFRRLFESGGVLIEILKVDNIYKLSPDELDYCFAMAKALGARAISTEISKDNEDLRRIGQFADKHQLMVGYHGHATTTPAHWETAFSLSRFNGANVDLGHFVAGNNESPAAFIQKHHARITHVHVKDRRKQNGPNTPFGEGDTPIRDILRLIRDNRWNIQATIEFEYKVPAESERMKEIARAIQYCRDALA
jgi:sugar phosphate isomerase/epimerase